MKHARSLCDFSWPSEYTRLYTICFWIFYPCPVGSGCRSGREVIKRFSCSTQLSTKFILLINVKMPTIVGILKFISMINTTSARIKANTSLFVGNLVFMSSWNFVLNLVELEKSFIDSGPGAFSRSHLIMRHTFSTLIENTCLQLKFCGWTG